MSTGFVWNERYAWHDFGSGAGPLRAEGWIEPGESHVDSPASKRRIRNLLDASGLLAKLDPIEATPLAPEALSAFHTTEYVQNVRALSAGTGGPLGLDAWAPPGSYDIAALAAGGTVAAVDAVMSGRVDNAYALVRPCGHHAEPAGAMGFTIFNNVVLGALHARRVHDVQRLAILDWDAHHGNGAQGAFFSDPDVLTISLHQDGLFPPGSGGLDEVGDGAGRGFNVNVPLPPGSGSGAYAAAFDRIVIPALLAFEPELIMVASGFDANGFDPLSRLLLSPETFRTMTEQIMAVAAETSAGRLVLSHEGGYHPGVVPFCGLAVIEALSGHRTEVEDPFSPLLEAYPWQRLQPHQDDLLAQVLEAGPYLRALR